MKFKLFGSLIFLSFLFLFVTIIKKHDVASADIGDATFFSDRESALPNGGRITVKTIGSPGAESVNITYVSKSGKNISTNYSLDTDRKSIGLAEVTYDLFLDDMDFSKPLVVAKPGFVEVEKIVDPVGVRSILVELYAGDVSQDGLIDSMDVKLASEFILLQKKRGASKMIRTIQGDRMISLQEADVNCDGVVSLEDISIIKKNMSALKNKVR